MTAFGAVELRVVSSGAIAAVSQSDAPSSQAQSVNAMSIDVEDYFHVSVFDGVVPRADVGWAGEPRVCRTPAACWICSMSSACAVTFFVLGLGG